MFSSRECNIGILCIVLTVYIFTKAFGNSKLCCAKNEVYRHRRIHTPLKSVCEGSFTCDLHMKSLFLDFALKERNIFTSCVLQ